MGIFWRWFGAFVLLAATFNPTPYNYVRWAGAHFSTETPLAVLLGLILTIGYIIYLNATVNAIGGFGMLLIAAVFGATIWVLIDWGVLTLGNTDVNLWLGILALSVVLGIGLSWGILRQKLTGQATVDDVDG
jgi:hypothetical protein